MQCFANAEFRFFFYFQKLLENSISNKKNNIFQLNGMNQAKTIEMKKTYEK